MNTEQRSFPFFVNGQYWKNMTIDELNIRDGRFIYPIMTQTGEMPDMMAPMKKVVFQLAECSEQKNGRMANWISGFWLCDDDIYFEKENIYLKAKEE